MASLDDLLALAPDNTTGDISAADLRAIITGLFEHVTAMPGGTWQFSATPGPPAAKQVTTDVVPVDQATAVMITTEDMDRRDWTGVLASLAAGSSFYAQGWDDASAYAVFNVTGVPTDNGTYFSIPVTWVRGGGDPVTKWATITVQFVIGV